MTSTPSLLKTLVETSGELGVSVPEQEACFDLAVLHLPGQIPRLLHHPLPGRAVGAAGEVNATAANLDKEEDIEPGQPDRVDGEEVAGQDLVGVLVDELAPRSLTAARGWQQAMTAKHPAHGLVGAAMAHLAKLALDSPVPPTWVLPRQLQDQIMNLGLRHGSLPGRSSPIRGPFAPDQLPMPAQQSLWTGQQ
jgi:hypothetical protein